MAKSLWRYSVVDTKSKELICENGTVDDVCIAIGVGKFNVSKYAVNGYLYLQRYAISATPWEPSEEVDDAQLNSAFTPELVEEWNNVMLLFHPKKAVTERETV